MNTKKVYVLIQARMDSKRLPGKVLKKIKGKTLIEILLDRLRKSKRPDKLIVLTSTSQSDDVLANYLKNKSITYFRGDENDVLDRYYSAVKKYPCDYVVRITGDCPLVDPNLLDQLIELALNTDADYCSNVFYESFPDGQDIEVFKYNVLRKAWQEAKLLSEREHVTPYIIKNTDVKGGGLFTAQAYESDSDYSNVRMTVDTLSDFNTIRTLINNLGVNESWDVYTSFILKNPENFFNQEIVRNLGYLKSLKND
jgi:spore coat polysaccharide biosynthesis protein SpsF (cytidylyltransferase family)